MSEEFDKLKAQVEALKRRGLALDQLRTEPHDPVETLLPKSVEEPLIGTLPSVDAFHNANVPVADVTWTSMPLNSENYDSAALHDLSTNNSRVVAPVAGMYVISGYIVWDNNATGLRGVRLLQNGAMLRTLDVVPAQNLGFTGVGQGGSRVLRLDAGDYIELQAWQNSGASRNVVFIDGVSPTLGMSWQHHAD